MSETAQSKPMPGITGVTDTRGTSLISLAAGGSKAWGEDSLRNVLPIEDADKIPVCAFGSSI